MNGEIKLYRIVHYNYTLKERCDHKYWVPENNGGEGGYVNPPDFKLECLLVCASSESRALEKAKLHLKDEFLGYADVVPLLEEDVEIKYVGELTAIL